MRKVRTLLTLIVLAWFVSACQPVMPVAEQPPAGLRPDAPPYAVRGPFAVGYKPLVIGEGTELPLGASLWYPALNPTGESEEVTYAFKIKDATWPADIPTVIHGHALLNAAVDGSQGPYPLVVYSHGFSSVNAAWTHTLLEHYASYGFIVLAPEHIEQFDPEFGDLWKASIDRPRDIAQTPDYAEELTAPGGEMAGLIDMEHVAVVSHAYGGYTALAMAGAQYDLAAYNARCAQLPEDDWLSFLCAPLVPKEADMAARAGLDPMPQGLWPSFGDPRVTAIIPMAGDSYLFDQAGLSKITIPMMAIGGTADTGTPYEWGSKPAYDYASSAQKALVTFVGAEHIIVGTPCENMPWVSQHPAYVWFCFDPVWDKERALDLIHYFSTAFLLDTLKGDQEAHAALLPDAVSFPGIEYVTTMK
jgi:predicted dienelactone hydrolase